MKNAITSKMVHLPLNRPVESFQRGKQIFVIVRKKKKKNTPGYRPPAKSRKRTEKKRPVQGNGRKNVRWPADTLAFTVMRHYQRHPRRFFRAPMATSSPHTYTYNTHTHIHHTIHQSSRSRMRGTARTCGIYPSHRRACTHLAAGTLSIRHANSRSPRHDAIPPGLRNAIKKFSRRGTAALPANIRAGNGAEIVRWWWQFPISARKWRGCHNISRGRHSSLHSLRFSPRRERCSPSSTLATARRYQASQTDMKFSEPRPQNGILRVNYSPSVSGGAALRGYII